MHVTVLGLSSSTWNLVGSSSLARDQTQGPCIRNTESYPLNCQGSPKLLSFVTERILTNTSTKVSVSWVPFLNSDVKTLF